MAALVACRRESWDRFLTGAEDAATASPASQAACARVIGALRDLGPGARRRGATLLLLPAGS